MLQESRLIWYTHPTREQVEGKLLLTEWYPREAPEITDMRYGLMFNGIEWARLKRFSILSTGETQFCNWKKFADNGENGHYETNCDHSFYGAKAGNCEVLNFSFCPHCALPIRVVTEPEVMELNGFIPEVKNICVNVWKIDYIVPGMTVYFYGDSKKQVTERWNTFASKMKGG